MGYSPGGHKRIGQDLVTKQQQHMCQKREQTTYTAEKGLKGKKCLSTNYVLDTEPGPLPGGLPLVFVMKLLLVLLLHLLLKTLKFRKVKKLALDGLSPPRDTNKNKQKRKLTEGAWLLRGGARV